MPQIVPLTELFEVFVVKENRKKAYGAGG